MKHTHAQPDIMDALETASGALSAISDTIEFGECQERALKAVDFAIGNTNWSVVDAAQDMLAALQEIAKGEGAFSRDRMEHASNVIQNSIRIAKEAIAKATGGTE